MLKFVYTRYIDKFLFIITDLISSKILMKLNNQPIKENKDNDSDRTTVKFA